jgi:SagB-type dehydrogenase family enzyme
MNDDDGVGDVSAPSSPLRALSEDKGMLLRCASNLVMYWNDENDLTIENFVEHTAFAVDSLAIRLLDAFAEETDPEIVVEQLESYDPTSVRSAIQALIDSGLLVESRNLDHDRALSGQWRHWQMEARYFHFATRNADFLIEIEEQLALLEQLNDEPQPPLFKRNPTAERIYLPRDTPPLDAPFGKTLVARRTYRSPGAGPLKLRDLAAILYFTFAPMRFIESPTFGTLLSKTSPNGGARHETECYVAALDVDDLPVGLYHYCGDDHSLEVVRRPFTREMANRLCCGQAFCAQANALCFLTAIFGRTMHKYRYSRAYRAMLLNTGHIAQTFVLTCTALGLGAFQTAAFRDSEVDEAIGVDGLTEGSLYVVGTSTMPPPDGTGRI